MKDDRYYVAVHEAAHTVMQFLVGIQTKSVSIIPDDTTAGRAVPVLERSPEPKIDLVFGTPAAERERWHARI